MAQESVFGRLGSALVAGVSEDPVLGPVPAPGNVSATAATLEQACDSIENADSLQQWIQAVADWEAAVDDLANAAYGGGDAVNALVARAIQTQTPRLAAGLSVFGALTADPPDGRPRLDMERALNLLTSADTVVTEAFWDDLLGDHGAPGDGRRIAILVALLIMAPQTIAALVCGNLTVADLPARQADGPGLWSDFLTKSQDWISVTLPFGDPAAAQPHPASAFDNVAGIDPDLSGTLAGYTRRSAAPGGGRRTDFELWLALALEQDNWRLDLGNDWFLQVTPGLSVGLGRVGGNWHGAFRALSSDPSRLPDPRDPVEITVGRDPAAGGPDILLGPPYDTRVEIGDVTLYLRIRDQEPIAEIGFMLDDLALVLSNRWFRVFGATDSLFREGIRFDADAELGYVQGSGLKFNSSGSLDILWNVDARLGNDNWNFKLHSFRSRVPFDVQAGEYRIRLEVTAHASVQLSKYVGIVVDGAGAWVGRWKDDLQNAAKEFKNYGGLPPTGGGIHLSFPKVEGGGYFERKTLPDGGERWAGGVLVKVSSFGVKAFGIYEVDANDNKSFLFVLGINFGKPGFQLGTGFALTGIGGIIGIDRRIDTDALRERLTSGAVGNVLFLEDPIKNAPTIIGDAAALFPAEQGNFIVGPTFQLTWLDRELTRIDCALVLEFPGPSKILLLGRFEIKISGVKKDKPLLKMRLDFSGFVDFDKKVVEFDATLIDSKVLEVWVLTGDAAWRSSWAEDDGYFLLTIGGFHPRYDPAPIVLPSLERVALTQTPGFFSAGLHMRIEAYFAVGSNAVQLGLAAEIGVTLGPLNATAVLKFDALITFKPFYFDIAFTIAARIRWRSTTLAGARLVGSISGPGPTRIRGEACIEILFFDICAEASFTIGEAVAAIPEAVVSLVQALLPELTSADNLVSAIEDPAVAVTALTEGVPEPVVGPLGQLVWQQRRAPLDLEIKYFEGTPLQSEQAVIATSPQARGSVTERFAPGQYLELTEAEKLNRPDFERMKGGLTLGFDMQKDEGPLARDVQVRTIRLPKVNIAPLLGAITLPVGVLAGLVARNAETATTDAAPLISATEPGWTVIATGGAPVLSGTTAADAQQRARRAGGVAVRDGDVVDMGVF